MKKDILKTYFTLGIIIFFCGIISGCYILDIRPNQSSESSNVKISQKRKAYICSYKVASYNASIIDSLHKYNLFFKPDTIQFWVERGYDIVYHGFYCSIVFDRDYYKNYYRLSYESPTKGIRITQHKIPYWGLVEKNDTNCMISLYQNQSRIILNHITDTMYMKSYVYFDRSSDDCLYIGEIKLVRDTSTALDLRMPRTYRRISPYD